ncbi:MAG: methyltransferase domain-containing protein [Verrucomicrobiia bacterium]
MTTCSLCGQRRCSELVQFGDQPVCHHYFDGGEPEGTNLIGLGQCEACGLVQLTRAIPAEMLVPRFDWIAYNEPEGHLDDLVAALGGLPGMTPAASIAGTSYKEDSTLARFRRLGYAHTWRIDPISDLGASDCRTGMETIQSRLRPDVVEGLRRKHGPPDVVIVRHVLEHTDNPREFMEALRQLVRPGGYVVFEVPDCARGFDLFDYTVLWEDHSLYFGESTLRMCLRRGGFSIVRFLRFTAPYENSLVAIASPQATTEAPGLTEEEMQTEKNRVQGFAGGFPKRRAALRRLLADWRQHGKVAMFGAGHHAAMFINLMGVADLIDFVVDDHPRKCGLRMPGSRLPIVNSGALIRENVRLCLTSLGFESEMKVVQRHRDFVGQGGTFASIFPVNPETLLNFVAGPSQPIEAEAQTGAM